MLDVPFLNTFKLMSKYLDKRTTFISVPIGLGVFMSSIIKTFTLGKIDYVEKVQRMGEDRNFPHDKAMRDFGYKRMSFEEGIKIEIEDYLQKLK